MRRKVFRHYIILIVLCISISGFFASELAQRFYRYEVEEKLIIAATLIEHQLTGYLEEGRAVDYDSFSKDYALVMPPRPGDDNIRLTVIAPDGKVLGESETDYEAMENHLNRKEVREALKGNIGKDTRFSRTLKMEFLYIAVPVKKAGIVLRVSVPLIQLININRTIWIYTLAAILAGLLLAALPAFRFSASLTDPINELNLTSREIALGNYSKRVGTKAPDELGQLAQSFNAMAERLEKTVADLRDKNLKVDSIIDSLTNGIVAVDGNYRVILFNAIACTLLGLDADQDIMGSNILEIIRNNHVNAALKETMERNTASMVETVAGGEDERYLRIYTSPIRAKGSEDSNSGGIVSLHDITNIKKLEQIRTDFVSNVTHELKTPLTSIRGFIETLRGGALDDREVSDKFLEIIDIEAERLSMLINDILQLSEIESKQRDTNIRDYSLKPIVDEVVSVLGGLAARKNVSLDAEVENNIIVAVNRDRIKQMLINLIDNGIKYNKPGGSVNVKACRKEGKVVLSVSDTGIGIPPEHAARIFERFYRVDKGRSRSMGGTGLGLSIVKHIVNLYNGDIKIRSEPGKGTEFIIQLPI